MSDLPLVKTENTDKKQSVEKHWQFKDGQSGNPLGRPKGARNRTTMAVRSLLDGEAEALTRKAVEMAMGGDVIALRLCLERIAPIRKDAPVVFSLPDIAGPDNAATVMSALLAAVAGGDITPSEGGEIARLVETYLKAVEANEFNQRLKALEERATP